MKIFFKIILWFCMITTVVTVVPPIVSVWDELPENGELFVEQVLQLKGTENDDSDDDNLPTDDENLPADDDMDGLTNEEEDRIGTNKFFDIIFAYVRRTHFAMSCFM